MHFALPENDRLPLNVILRSTAMKIIPRGGVTLQVKN